MMHLIWLSAWFNDENFSETLLLLSALDRGVLSVLGASSMISDDFFRVLGETGLDVRGSVSFYVSF